MKNKLILLSTILLFSCGTRKVENKKIDVTTKEVTIDKSITETKADTNVKITTNTETNKETGEVTETETLEPIDNTKPATYIDENGKSQSLNNAKKTKTKTKRKTNENKKANIVVDKVEKVAKKQQNDIKTKSKVSVQTKDKSTVSDKGNFWNWILLIIFGICIIWFVVWSRKIVNDKEKLEL